MNQQKNLNSRTLGYFQYLALAIGLALPASTSAATAIPPRERILIDDAWKFHLGDDWGTGENLMKAGISTGPADPTFCDVSFRAVNLPHDWVVELPFDSKSDRSHGYKPVGKNYPTNSIGWYRHTFTLPKSDDGKRIWLDFDGVYRDCLVFVNGYSLGRHQSGYDSFRYDITDVAHYGGENVLAVRVDASKFEGWFYEGAGIYRHVWLEKTAPVAIAPDGIFVYSKFENNVPSDKVEVDVKTQVANSLTNDAVATVAQEIVSPTGESVARLQQDLKIGTFSKEEAKCKMFFNNPTLWSPESPKLYKLITTVIQDGRLIDRKETEFGLRTFAFDTDKGFLLNGKPYLIYGTCNHQDHAGVGVAMPDALQYDRIAKLKEFGCNAYRTSHNAPTPELLDACDHLGMLVMDENRLLGSDPENLALLEGQIRRDRNHASVFIWSICNEEHVQGSPTAARIADTMQRDVHRLDPTRSVTSAVSLGDVYEGIDGVMDVRGWNYHLEGGAPEDYHRKHPAQPEICTEQASTLATRGIYTNDAEHGYVSAYDTNRGLTQRAEGWWSFVADHPWLSGGFVWTGFDYRGEPTPYNWPCISSQFGIVDTCGFPKDNFYYYQAWWTTNPIVHLFPHWNWPGHEGQDVEVWCDSNCQEVELFLNGQSLGKKSMNRNSHLQWTVKYAPGTLSAKGYNAGQIAAQTKVETTGQPAAIQLTPDRADISADGRDLSLVTVAVTDASGRTVPTAGNLIHFDLDGPGKIIGVGNGNPASHEPDTFIAMPAERSGTMNHWWMKKVKEAADHPETAEKANDTRWDLFDAGGDAIGLSAGESGVYRAHLSFTPDDLAPTNITIHFGLIKDEGWIYVNGKLAGESHAAAASPSINVRKYLHSGANTIAVLVKSKEDNGGLGHGVSVTLRDTPVTPDWRRSAFNGLAQVIVQSGNSSGDIKLTAHADGLAPATVVIHPHAVETAAANF